MQYIKTKNLTQKKQVLCGLRGIFLLFSCQTPEELGPTGAVLKCTVWTKDIDDNFTACSDIRRQIKKEFDEGGIEMYQPILPGNGGAQK